MKREPLELIDGFYEVDAKPWSAQDALNYIPVRAEQAGTRSAWMLLDAPGVQEFSYVGDGPIRVGGMIVVAGKLFIVSGDGFYQVFASGFALRLGTVPGSGPVALTFNQITFGNQVVIGNGVSGYVWDTVTQVFERITDPGFPGFLINGYIASQIVGIEPQRRYFFNSALADALSYNAEDTYEAEESPDLMVGLLVIHNEVWIGSETTISVFQYTGTLNALFQNKNYGIEQGVSGTFSMASADNSVFFFGSDGKFYRMNGPTPQRISTFAIEQAVAGFTAANCFAMVWADRGHLVVYWTFPDGLTFGYDIATGKWHRRASYGLNRWRMNALVEWNGVWYGGDFQTGQLYALDWDLMLDGPNPHQRRRTTGVLHANQNLVTVESLELVLDTGAPVSVYEPGYTQTPWWLTEGVADTNVAPRIYRAPATLDSWAPTDGITKTGGSALSVRDMRFFGNAVVSQNLVADGKYGIIQSLNPDATVGEQSKTLAFTTGNIRQDCINRRTGYGPQMLTINGGVTLSTLVPPTGVVLTDLVRTGSGRWLGIGQSSAVQKFFWTDDATPTATWTNAGQLPGVGGVDIGGFNTTMDASQTAVVCSDPATFKIYRSANTGIAFSLAQTLTVNNKPTYIKWLTGTKWIASTFSTIDQAGSLGAGSSRIWTSSDDGVTWVVSTSSSQIASHAQINLSYGGGVVLLGALWPDVSNKLWKSTDDGVTWEEVALPSTWMDGFSSGFALPLTCYVG